MESKESVTLTKNGREIVLTIPRDIVEYKAAGWREKKAAPAPVADTAADAPAAPKPDGPKSAEDPSSTGADPRPAAVQAAAKGGSKK